MKKLIIAFLVATTSIVSAQKEEYKESIGDITKVIIESDTKIKVIAGNTSDLILSKLKKTKDNVHWSIESDREKIKKRKEEKRKGLTAIYPGGKDNTNGLGFSISRNGTTLILKDLKSHFQRNGVQISLPKNMNITADAGQLGNVYIKGFSSEIEVETNVGKIVLEDVTGPITAHSSVGSITIDFSIVSQVSPITISTSTSEIDVALPTNTKASLDMKTNGTVYTNFDLKASEKDGLKDISSKKITGNINNGGVKIKLKSSLGNIYLRKK